MLEIDKEIPYKIKKNILLKNILNETFFILDSNTGKQYNLSEMEYEIINQISKGIPFVKIVDKISSEYKATKNQIEQDLIEYFYDLINEGIIYNIDNITNN